MAKRLAVEIFLVALVGFVLGLFGPFGSFAIPLAPRLIYWTLFALAGYVIFRPLILVGRWVAEVSGVPVLVGIGGALALASLPTTLFVASAFNGFALPRHIDNAAFLELYGQVWLIGFLINGLFSLLLRKPEEKPSEQRDLPQKADEPSSEPTAFADRLPPGFGRVLALKGEDHYVRAIGEISDVLILLRLRDAVAELPAGEGLQVHRSWWVARDAVARIKRDGRSAIITLENQAEVPVSRDNMARLKSAGWL